jgi:hypothetical protein
MDNLSTATPVQIDTELSERYFHVAQARQNYDRIHNSMLAAEIAKAKGEYSFTSYDDEDELVAHRALKSAIESCLPLEEEYERRPWNRYWHVTNANGHIHRSQSCTSCFPDTQYGWRTDLSGLTEQEVVDREAYNACSVCMPIAPAEQKAARERYNKEQRDARKAEKLAKQAAKYEKALARARKHAEKVEKALLEMTGAESVPEARMRFRRDFSLYGHDSRASVYEATAEMPQMVHDTLYAMKEAQESPTRPLRDLSEAVKTALTERNLI